MKKLLLIEDNIDIRDNIAEFLGLNGFSVLTAKNGKAGVELALKEIPDIIVCDILMPVLDGYGVLYLLSKNSDTSGNSSISQNTMWTWTSILTRLIH